MTILERFEEQAEKIRADAEATDRAMKAKRGEWESKLATAREKQAKAAAIRDRLRAEYETIEAETIEEARARASASAVKGGDVLSGAVSLGEYYRAGQSESAIDSAARAEAMAKLNVLLAAVRAKGLEVLEAEVEVAEAEREILFLNSYAPASMLERLQRQVKSLEAYLMPAMNTSVMTVLRVKREELARAKGEGMDGTAWRELTIEAVKKLRLDPSVPDAELPALEKIIEDMATRPNAKVTLQYVPMGPKKGLSVAVVWA
jgi:hypothetical protein